MASFIGTNDALSQAMFLNQMSQVDPTTTPSYLNTQRANTRTQTRSAWDTSRNNAYQQAQQALKSQFTDIGDPNAAAPYLALLEKDYNGLQYHPGTDYSYDGPEYSGAWDEQAYLAANPDVAANLQETNSTPDRANDPNYWHTGLDQYMADPNRAARGGVSPGFMNPGVQPNLIGGTADTWDDPGSLLNKDYGAGTAITNIRQGRKDTARTAGQTDAHTLLNGMGLGEGDVANLGGWIDKRIGDTYQNAGLSANSYTDVFDPQAILDSVLTQERNKGKTMLQGRTNTAFAGIDPNLSFADTADDQYINDIVGKQYDSAFGGLDRAYKRGALTDMGYNAGLSSLGDQRSAANNTAQTLGGAVLTRNRGDLAGIKNSAMDAVGAYDFGKSLDPTSYVDQYNTKKSSLEGGLGGEIAGALAGQNFFDVGSVLNTAGYAQGAQNTAPLTSGFTTPAGAAVAATRDKDKNATRGLGGTGVF